MGCQNWLRFRKNVEATKIWYSQEEAARCPTDLLNYSCKNGVICKCVQFAPLAYHVSTVGCGASLGGSQSNASNPILELCSGTFLLMTSDYN